MEINIRVPGNLCSLCKSIIQDSYLEGIYSLELIDSISKSKFVETPMTCSFCEREFSHIPITLDHDSRCKQCNKLVEEDFCSKRCAIHFIEKEIDNNDRRKKLKEKIKGEASASGT